MMKKFESLDCDPHADSGDGNRGTDETTKSACSRQWKGGRSKLRGRGDGGGGGGRRKLGRNDKGEGGRHHHGRIQSDSAMKKKNLRKADRHDVTLDVSEEGKDWMHHNDEDSDKCIPEEEWESLPVSSSSAGRYPRPGAYAVSPETGSVHIAGRPISQDDLHHHQLIAAVERGQHADNDEGPRDPGASDESNQDDADKISKTASSENDMRWFRTRRGRVIIALLVLFAVVIAVVVPIAVVGGGDSDDDSTEAPEIAVTYDEMRQFLVDRNISTRQSLDQAGSPQRLALDWIFNEDRFPLDLGGDEAHHFLFVQRYAVVVLHFAVGKERFLIASESVCRWDSIKCEEKSFSFMVTTINLQDDVPPIGASFIPPEIRSVTALESLNLCKNNIKSPAIGVLASLTNLKKLYLCVNSITASEVGDIERLISLETLDLNVNDIEGTLPQGLYRLTSLKKLFMSQNKLTGTLSDSISNLSSLEILNLGRNELNGTLPTGMRSITSLRTLNLDANDFQANLFQRLPLNPAFQSLNLFDNSFTGVIPTDIATLSLLETLQLSRNELSSTIPSELGDLSNLSWLELGGNNLTGTVPSELGKLWKLKKLTVGENELTGTMPEEICRWEKNTSNGIVKECESDCGISRPPECCTICS